MQPIYLYSMFSPFLIFGLLKTNNRITDEKRNRLLLILYSIQTAIIIGTRTLDTGSDTFAYFRMFNNIANLSSPVTAVQNGIEPLFSLIAFICAKINIGYVGFNITVAALTMVFFSLAIYRTSISSLLSLYIYNCFALYAQMINQSRQVLAMAVVLYAIANLIEDRKVIFVMWVIVASLIHTSAIICFALLFIYRRELTPKLLGVYFLSGLFVLVMHNTLFSIIIRYSRYGRYLTQEWRYSSFNDSAIMNTIVRITMLLLALLFYKELVLNSERMNMFYHMIIICTILQTLCVFNNALGRITTYFFYGYFIVIPDIVETTEFANLRKNKMILYPIIIIGLFVYYVVRMGNMRNMEYASVLFR